MANLSVEEPDALMRARPDLWEPWWETARAPRPDVIFYELTGVSIGRRDSTTDHPIEPRFRCTWIINETNLQ